MGLIKNILDFIERFLADIGVSEVETVSPTAPSQPETPTAPAPITPTPAPEPIEQPITVQPIIDPTLTPIEPLPTQPETQPTPTAPFYPAPKTYPSLNPTEPTAPTQKTPLKTVDERAVYTETYRQVYDIIVFQSQNTKGELTGLYSGIARPNSQPYAKFVLPATGIGQSRATVTDALNATRTQVDNMLETAANVEANATDHPNVLY